MGVVMQDDGGGCRTNCGRRCSSSCRHDPCIPCPRTPDRRALDDIFLVLRTGMQWRALMATGLCRSSSAYRCYWEWLAAGVFWAFWRQGLLMYDALVGIDWEWLAWMEPKAKRRWVGKKPAPTPRTESSACG